MTTYSDNPNIGQETIKRHGAITSVSFDQRRWATEMQFHFEDGTVLTRCVKASEDGASLRPSYRAAFAYENGEELTEQEEYKYTV